MVASFREAQCGTLKGMREGDYESQIEAALNGPHLAQVDMGDLGEVRKLLGDRGPELSDAEVERIRDLALAVGDAMFHWWLRRRGVEH